MCSWPSIGSGPRISSPWTSSLPRAAWDLLDHNEAISPESRYLGARITEIPDRVRLASPITYVGEQMPPILIQHGRADNLVPFQQSVQLAEAIEARVGAERFELDLFDGAVHGDPVFESEQNLERVFDFIERRLR